MTNSTKSSGEPALIQGTATAVVAALIALLVSFGVNLTTDQTEAILGFVAIAGPLVAGWLIRRQVTPKANVAAVVNESGVTVAGAAAPQGDGTPVVITTL